MGLDFDKIGIEIFVTPSVQRSSGAKLNHGDNGGSRSWAGIVEMCINLPSYPPQLRKSHFFKVENSRKDHKSVLARTSIFAKILVDVAVSWAYILKK